MADEQVVDDTTKQPDESAEPPQKKRCLPEFLKEDSAKWTLDSDLAEAIKVPSTRDYLTRMYNSLKNYSQPQAMLI